MPSRWMSLAIVVFWMSATGWLIWRDLAPDWRTGEPPPFHIDLVDEVRKSHLLDTTWTVTHKENKDFIRAFKARTGIYYTRKSDTFTLYSEYSANSQSLHPPTLAGLWVNEMKSEYRVNRAGQLRSLWVGMEVSKKRYEAKKAEENLNIVLHGEVREGRFFAHCEGRIPSLGKSIKFDLPPAAVSENGSVLMPLHPVNRIRGLRPGQTWRQPVIDPFRDAFASLPGFAGGVRSVNARVLPQPELLGEEEIPCWVIEYEQEGKIVGRTWVDQRSERVLRQESDFDDDHWVMQRDRLSSSNW